MALVPSKKQNAVPLATPIQQMNRLFDDFFSHDFFVEPFRGMGEWQPALDVAETDTAIIVRAELPGMEPGDVEVSLSGDILTLKGEKKEEKEERTKNVHRVERSYGSFQRAVRLPSAVKAEQVEATFKNGVLTVNLPKTEQTKSKTVKIKPQ